MNLVISNTSSRPAPAAKNANPGVDTLSYAIGECAIGLVLVARSDRGVCAILIGDMDEDLTDDLANRFPEAELIANEIAVHDDLAKVILFVKKPADGLHLTLDMRGTPFQRRVWEELCYPCRQDDNLYGIGPSCWRTDLAARGRRGLRRQSHCLGDPLSPRRAQRRRSRGLSLGYRTQA